MALLQDSFWPTMLCDGAGCTQTQSMPSPSDYITSCLLELERLNQELKSKLLDDIVNILDGVDNITLSSDERLPSPPPSPPSPSSSLTHDISFVADAYSWLLENIANPYPSPTVKASLAQRYNRSLSAINTWFVNARRRMGWTALCRDHFSNCRADALDAAYRALVKEDPDRQLPAAIIHAFIGVKAAAEELYSSTQTKSALASDLDIVVKNMSDQEGTSMSGQKCSKRKGTTELTPDLELQTKKLPPQNYCLSSKYSPPSSPVPTLDESVTDGSENDEDILPPPLAGRKRRFSSSEEAHAPASESTTRLVKRLRSNSGTCSIADACLPSPATSAEGFLEDDQMTRSVSISQSSTSLEPHKRRLSGADTIGSPKHPRDSTTGPHFHADSDLFLLSTSESERSIDDWFKTSFGDLFSFPPPVGVTEPDHSTQWEVELFSNYSIPEDIQKPFTRSIQANQTPLSADLIPLEDLLQSLENGGFAVPLETTAPFTTASVPVPISHGQALSPNFSQTIDWTRLFNEDFFESISEPMFPLSCFNTTLPEVDPSILQLPQAWTTVA